MCQVRRAHTTRKAIGLRIYTFHLEGLSENELGEGN
jgi:hypothetical protein